MVGVIRKLANDAELLRFEITKRRIWGLNLDRSQTRASPGRRYNQSGRIGQAGISMLCVDPCGAGIQAGGLSARINARNFRIGTTPRNTARNPFENGVRKFTDNRKRHNVRNLWQSQRIPRTNMDLYEQGACGRMRSARSQLGAGSTWLQLNTDERILNPLIRWIYPIYFAFFHI